MAKMSRHERLFFKEPASRKFDGKIYQYVFRGTKAEIQRDAAKLRAQYKENSYRVAPFGVAWAVYVRIGGGRK